MGMKVWSLSQSKIQEAEALSKTVTEALARKDFYLRQLSFLEEKEDIPGLDVGRMYMELAYMLVDEFRAVITLLDHMVRGQNSMSIMEEEDAAKERVQQKNNQPQHQGNEEGWVPPETGGCSCPG